MRAHPVYAGHSTGHTQAPLVDHVSGSVHTGLSIEQLPHPASMLEPHVHSYEESFYILSGQAIVRLGERDFLLTAGDYGVAMVGYAARLARARNGTQCDGCEWPPRSPNRPDIERDNLLYPRGLAAASASPPDWAQLDGTDVEPL